MLAELDGVPGEHSRGLVPRTRQELGCSNGSRRSEKAMAVHAGRLSPESQCSGIGHCGPRQLGPNQDKEEPVLKLDRHCLAPGGMRCWKRSRTMRCKARRPREGLRGRRRQGQVNVQNIKTHDTLYFWQNRVNRANPHLYISK